MVTAIFFYDVVKFVHIAAVIVAFGATYAYPFAFAVAERGDPRSMPSTLRWMNRFERFLLTPGMAVVLASGIYMAADRELFDEFWVSFGLLAILVLFALAGAYFAPRERRLIELAERDLDGGQAALSDEFMRLYKQLNAVGAAVGVLVLVVAFLMTTKP
jgi:uncharacterized membrane protein